MLLLLITWKRWAFIIVLQLSILRLKCSNNCNSRPKSPGVCLTVRCSTLLLQLQGLVTSLGHCSNKSFSSSSSSPPAQHNHHKLFILPHHYEAVSVSWLQNCFYQQLAATWILWAGNTKQSPCITDKFISDKLKSFLLTNSRSIINLGLPA